MEQGTLGVLPENLTQLGLTFLYANVSTLYEGNKSVKPVDEDSLETFITTFQLRHTFGDGLSVDLGIPIGTLRFEEGEKGNVLYSNGLGDISLGLRYDLWALWGAGGYSPSIVANATLGLPTGQFLKTEILGDATPEFQLLPLGLGAYSTTVGLDYTQHIHKLIALRVPVWAKFPLHANSNGHKMGNRYGYGLGVVIRPFPGFVVGAAVDGTLGGKSSGTMGGGEVTVEDNSGGHWMGASLNVGYRLTDRLFASVMGRMPIYTDVNGQQLSETFRVMGSLTVSFGADPSKTHDCAHEGPGDHHHHFDEGGTDLGPHDDEAKGHDHHGAESHEGHDHEGHDHEGHDHKAPESGAATGCGSDCQSDCCKKEAPKKGCGSDCKSDCCKKKQGDILNAATGGKSFAIKDVVVPGKVTVIDYWAEWCKPCKAITKMLVELARTHPNLAIRKVEVPNFDAPVVKEHIPNVPKIPVVWVYDAQGKRVSAQVAPEVKSLRKEILTLLK